MGTDLLVITAKVRHRPLVICAKVSTPLARRLARIRPRSQPQRGHLDELHQTSLTPESVLPNHPRAPLRVAPDRRSASPQACRHLRLHQAGGLPVARVPGCQAGPFGFRGTPCSMTIGLPIGARNWLHSCLKRRPWSAKSTHPSRDGVEPKGPGVPGDGHCTGFAHGDRLASGRTIVRLPPEKRTCEKGVRAMTEWLCISRT